jgi:hypothetical protein
MYEPQTGERPPADSVEYRGICPCGRALRSDGARGPNVNCTNCGAPVTLQPVGGLPIRT